MIDPATIPTVQMPSGAMPVVGLGTFGSDHIDHASVASTVADAIVTGYRHIDCASVYGNEAAIGERLATIVESAVPRDELWITSKVWNDMHGPGDVIASCEQTLRDLRLDHLDLYLVHWPFPNTHTAGASIDERQGDARPYIHDAYMDTWRQMETLVERGLVRNIGTSNMTIPKLDLLLRDATIRPAANEMELHPHFQQPDLFDHVRVSGMVPVGFSPIGSPARPERDRQPDDTVDIDDPVMVAIATAHGLHPATLCVKWAVQRGQVPIPFSTTPGNYTANLAAVSAGSPRLTDGEMGAIASIDRGSRLIKGQVFCWKPDQDWRDLWDEDGVIVQ